MTTASSSSARRAIERLRGSDRLRLDGLHVHIGLQMLDSHGQARPTHLPGRRRRHGDSLEVSFYGQRFEATVVDGVGGDGPVDLVGRHCESGDVLSAGVALREPRVGDVVARAGDPLAALLEGVTKDARSVRRARAPRNRPRPTEPPAPRPPLTPFPR
jgi:hypothetical protein